MKRFWVSWKQLSDDMRPLQDPPQPENIAAWWCSGSSGGYSILCAIVNAKSVEAAQSAVVQAWDSNGKEIGGFRFVDECENDWLPNDRFPITKDWERHRLGI